jgi:hypothetical protein
MQVKKIFYLFILPLSTLIFGCSQSEEINRECAAQNKDSFIARIQCIQRRDNEDKEFKKDLAKIQKQQEKEKLARECIAIDIPRMENLVIEAKKLVNENSKLEEINEKLNNLFYPNNEFSKYSKPIPSSDNIKEFVLVYEVKTTCKSDFHLLINIRANESGQLRYFNVWAKTAPDGYPSGFSKNLSMDFEEIRKKRNEQQKLAKDIGQRANDIDKDHCAPNLPQSVRLSRLSRFGTVRQTSERSYVTSDSKGASHGLRYDVFGNMQHCW